MPRKVIKKNDIQEPSQNVQISIVESKPTPPSKSKKSKPTPPPPRPELPPPSEPTMNEPIVVLN